jgi:hypothetical protein
MSNNNVSNYGNYNSNNRSTFRQLHNFGAFFGGLTSSKNGQHVVWGKYNGGMTYDSHDYGMTFRNIARSAWWGCMSSSRDGQYVVGGNLMRGQDVSGLWVSPDYGITFNPSVTSTKNNHWRTLSMSSSGQYIVAGTFNSNVVYISSDFGRNWKAPTTITLTNVTQIISSTITENGKYMAISTNTSFRPTIYLSEDYGNAWTQKTIDPAVNDCSGDIAGMAFSTNGKRFVVAVNATLDTSLNQFRVIRKGGIFISTDLGTTWTKSTAPTDRDWHRVVCSDNGQYVYAMAKNRFYGPPATSISLNNGGIYISQSFGTNWNLITDTSNISWQNIDDNNYSDWWCGNMTTTTSGQYLLASNLVRLYNYVASYYTYSYTPIQLGDTFDFTFTSQIYPGKYYLKTADLNILATVDVSGTPYNETDIVNFITFTNINTSTVKYGPNTLYIYMKDTYPDGSNIDVQISDPILVNATCFLEGTQILAMTEKYKVKYIPIEKLKPGMLVKTLHAGFVPIKYIGYSTMHNPGLTTRVRDQLYICKKSAYPELNNDLVLTGNHSILVDTITDEQRFQIIDTLGDIYITEKKYRMPAFNDTRAEPYEYQGNFRIWNLALENEHYYRNYGIYANGLLVETTSCRYMKELSGMTLIENVIT